MQKAKLTFKVLQLIHTIMCAGLILFIGVSFLVIKTPVHFDIRPTELPLLYVAPGFAAAMVFMSIVLYQSQITDIKPTDPLERRFDQFFSATIVRFGPLEAGALFNVVVFLLTSNLINLMVAVILLVLLISMRPVKDKAAEALQITYPETLD